MRQSITCALFSPRRTRSTLPLRARLLLLAAVSAFLGACAGGPAISADEHYDGQVAAGVVRPPGASGSRIQRRLIAALNASDEFAGVYPLQAPGQSSEVEVVITPSILDEQRGARGLEELHLQIRASRRSLASGSLDKTYRGKASGRGDALEDLIPALRRDLERRFGGKPIY